MKIQKTKNYGIEERRKAKEKKIRKYKEDDIVRYSFMDEPVKLYRVLSVYYWEDYDDAVAQLEDIETGEKTSMNTRCSGLEIHQEAEEKIFGWVQDKGQLGWQFRDITNAVGLQHIGENKYVEL